MQARDSKASSDLQDRFRPQWAGKTIRRCLVAGDGRRRRHDLEPPRFRRL